MIIPTFSECVLIVEEGDLLGKGASRAAYTHPDFPGIVVKKVLWNTDPLSLTCQNLNEVQNYKYLMAKGLPDNVMVPKTVAVGGYVVQELVVGEEVQGHPYDSASRSFPCDCLDNGLDFCWEALVYPISSDAHDGNVLRIGNTMWLFDLGVVYAGV